MNYKLAKKLKDAGFPFKPIKAGMIVGGGQSYFDFCLDFDASRGDVVPKEGCHFFVPTLSELIEACGEGFDSLRTRTVDNKKLFAAYPRMELLKENHLLTRINYLPSPEEVVANLYLALKGVK